MKYVAKLKASGYIVFGLRIPVIPSLYQLEQSVAGKEFENLVNGFKISGGIWINMPLITNGTYDGSHLDKWEAKRFSEKLGERLRQELDHIR